MKSKIYYFEENKPENTDILLDLVKEKALEKGIKYVVVASTRGETGVKTAKAFKDSGITVVVVTHQVGPRGPDLLEENETKMKALGAKIVTSTHAFGGIGDSLRRRGQRPQGQRPQGQRPQQSSMPAYIPPIGRLISSVLGIFGPGMKVCFEITPMAADAGAIPYGENVIAVAGQHRGADTAIIIKSAGTNSFFNMDVSEIIAKPIQKRLRRPGSPPGPPN